MFSLLFFFYCLFISVHNIKLLCLCRLFKHWSVKTLCFPFPPTGKETGWPNTPKASLEQLLPFIPCPIPDSHSLHLSVVLILRRISPHRYIHFVFNYQSDMVVTRYPFGFLAPLHTVVHMSYGTNIISPNWMTSRMSTFTLWAQVAVFWFGRISYESSLQGVWKIVTWV